MISFRTPTLGDPRMIASLVVGSRPYSALGPGADATSATMYSSVFITICLYLPWGERSGGRRMTPSSCSYRMNETYRMLAGRVVTSSAVVNTGRRPSGCIRRNCYGRSAHSSRYRSEPACSSASRSTSGPALLTRRILSYRPTSRRHLSPVAGFRFLWRGEDSHECVVGRGPRDSCHRWNRLM